MSCLLFMFRYRFSGRNRVNVIEPTWSKESLLPRLNKRDPIRCLAEHCLELSWERWKSILT